jgi:hypothetical protein
MSVGWGTGQRAFIGFGAIINCAHCNNRGVEQIFVTYSYEQAFMVHWKHLGDRGSEPGDGLILFLCPTCLHGSQVFGAEAAEAEKKRVAKRDGGAAAAGFAIAAHRSLTQAGLRFHLTETKKWFGSLSILAQRSTLKLYKRIGLYELSGRLR